MKFSATLLLLASLVAAHGDETHSNSTTPATCVTKIECKLNEEKSESDAAKKFESCASKADEAEKTKCIYAALGLKDEQVEKLSNLEKSISSCTPEQDPTLTTCIGACTGDKKDECIVKCMEPVIIEFGKCVKKLAEKPDFDFSKSLECSSKCTQDSISEVFDCDYECNKDLYDALIAKSGKNSTTEKDGKDDKTKEEGKGKEDAAKDGKSGNSTDKAKGGKSSAMVNFGMSSFGAVAVGTILFTLLI